MRNAGGFYRTAEGKDRAGGIPLKTANDAVVAAVRLAYKVAEAQIDRSTRLARRLRDAGDRADGPRSDRRALDATEKLVMKALMSGLAWWEGSVAEGRCPVKRLAAAEYQMLGSMLGLTPPPHAKASAARGPDDRPQRMKSERAADQAPQKAASSRASLQIVHRSERKDRRPVHIENWELATSADLQTDVYFFSVGDVTSRPKAELVLSGKRGARLILDTREFAPGGWRGAICDDKDVQVGFIEIVL